MNMQAIKSRHLPLLVGGVAAILVSGIAIGSLAISAQGFNGVAAPAEPSEAAAAPAIAAPAPALGARGCAGCGVIESTREIQAAAEKSGGNAFGRFAPGPEIEGKQVRNYEITIRLRDGSMRVITDPNPARWRPGERVQLIGGMDWPGG